MKQNNYWKKEKFRLKYKDYFLINKGILCESKFNGSGMEYTEVELK